MNNLIKLSELFQSKDNTQLMRQEVELYALKFIHAGSLTFLHSYYERTDKSSQNPVFSAPALVHKIEKNGNTVNLTLKTLKDKYDLEAVDLIRLCKNNEIEVGFSHIRPEYLSPKLKGADWDSWSLSYSVPQEEKIERRRARTREVAANLYRNFKKEDFEGKSILFLGCGEGDEIQTLLDYFQLKDAKVHGIDQSNALIDKCLRLKDKYRNIQMNFECLDLEKLSSLSEKSYDLIIAIGVFDRETLDFDHAVEILKRLKKDFIFRDLVIKSYSFDLFNSSQYEALGYTVKQSTFCKTLYTHNYSFFYRLEKSMRDPDSVRDSVAEESIAFWAKN